MRNIGVTGYDIVYLVVSLLRWDTAWPQLEDPERQKPELNL